MRGPLEIKGRTIVEIARARRGRRLPRASEVWGQRNRKKRKTTAVCTKKIKLALRRKTNKLSRMKLS